MQFSKLKKKLQEKLASHHIENENGKRQILSGESGIISILISEIVTIIEVSKQGRAEARRLTI